ncbi:hypothetical protein F2P81_008421 [Scophthalmus maximus]|uniref:Uncharacterized protein n=1 Tax=Scophthalmus maximus TaxID=52904 RepID=A0A6A4SY74_SCOMX|nr:hypothetical protein F2P81_008421 [Scophthalmus maximus]
MWPDTMDDADVEALELDLEQAKQDLACQVLRVTQVTAKLETLTKERASLSEAVDFLSEELEMVHARGVKQRDQLEKLREPQQPLDEAPLRQVNNDNQGVKEALEREVARLSTSLQTEIRNKKLLSKKDKNLAAEVRKEKSQILELTDQLQRRQDANEQELQRQQAATGSRGVMEAFLRELDGLKNSNLVLYRKLVAERQVGAALREQTAALRARTQKMEKSNNSRRLQAEKTKLEKDLIWGRDLQHELHRQNVLHLQRLQEVKEYKAHRLEELEALRAANRQLVGALRAEEGRVQELREKTLSTHAESLSVALRKDQTLRQELSALLQEVENQKAANHETLVKLRADRVAGTGQNFPGGTAEFGEEPEAEGNMEACVALSEEKLPETKLEAFLLETGRTLPGSEEAEPAISWSFSLLP